MIRLDDLQQVNPQWRFDLIELLFTDQPQPPTRPDLLWNLIMLVDEMEKSLLDEWRSLDKAAEAEYLKESRDGDLSWDQLSTESQSTYRDRVFDAQVAAKEATG